MVLLPLPGGLDVFDQGIFLVEEGASRPEDAYVLAESAIVDGVIDGDLIVAANRVSITGTINGDVLVATDGTVTIAGTVTGAVRGIAREVVIAEGAHIADDLAVLALTTRLAGNVGRDSIVFGGKLELEGGIGRDLRGRFVAGDLNGSIGRNADVSTSRLDVGPDTRIGGDLLYRSNRDADIADGAAVSGTLDRLSPRPSFFVDVWLTLATILGFFAFLLSGILFLWLAPGTSYAATAAIAKRPWRTLGLGVATLIAVPIVVWLFVRSFVGAPVAILLGVLYLLGFFFGPIPAVTVAGDKLLRGYGGIFGAFIGGAVVWRLGIAALPLVAGGLYVAALVWGVGGWAAAVWDGGRASYSEPSGTTITAST